MSDNYNDFNDEFFSKFDEMAGPDQKENIGTDTYSAEDGADEFMYKPERSREVKPSRVERAAREASAAGTGEHKSRKNKKVDKRKAGEAAKAAKDKAKKRSKAAKAKAIAASSRFGGSASGSSNRKPLAPESKGKAFFKTLVCICLMLVFAVGIYVGIIFIKAPAIDTDDLYSHISQRSVMYDQDGKEIENLYFSDGNRTVIKYKDIPENMINAVISIEDQKFLHHHGFNFIRMVGAIKDSIFGGGEISGTSTVTQQLARNVYLSEIKSQRSMSRKLTEMYCTIVLEKKLSKEQIMEAYLNTIYLGFNSYGVEAAAESYFNKKAKDLNLEQCAALAALPQSPDTYALVYSDYYNSMASLPKIKRTESVTYRYNGDMTTERRQLVLNNMCRLGYISEQERDEAIAKANNLKSEIKIGAAIDANRSSYFTDYCLKQLTADLKKEFHLSESDAENMIYTKGLKIYTTLDSNIQNIMEEEFARDSNYTSISYKRTNADGNLVSDQGVVLAYKYGYYFDDNDSFVLQKNEFRKNDDGGITLLKNKRLNFYSTETEAGPDVSVEFKGMFKEENGNFYFIESGALSIPQGYKSLDSNGNCVISGQFFTDYPNFFKNSEGGYAVSDDSYSLKQKVRQPQAAAVIMENETAEVKGMMGGRGATGKQLYNRAVNPRQPGSSIKPIAVYGPALQMSFEYHEANKKLALDTSEGSDWGKYITAGSVVSDSLTKDGNGKVWPLNDDHKYHGDQTVREALQQSLNVVSYKIFRQIDMNEGAEYSLDMMKKSGITTLNDESDANPAAISLGGLTRGLTPLEETAAYAVFPNGGVYKTPIFYTKVLNSDGNVKYEKIPEETKVYDPGVAWIMTDVLRSVVTGGIGRSASISSQPAAGKTGTTSNMYDIWFSGFTPQYSMALWMGNDINMSVSNYSYKAAQFWAAIMGRVCADIPRGSYFEKPDNVICVGGEYFIDGTYSKVTKKKSKTTKETEETSSSIVTETTFTPIVTTVAPTTTHGQESSGATSNTSSSSSVAPSTTAAPTTTTAPTTEDGGGEY